MKNNDAQETREKKEESGKKRGRPRAIIKKDQFIELCKIQCTRNEILAVLGITDKTLTGQCKREFGAGFKEVYDQFRSVGRMSLRRTQFNIALTNPTMAIWLGKQYLGQSDNPQAEQNAAEPVQIIFDIPDEEEESDGEDSSI